MQSCLAGLSQCVSKEPSVLEALSRQKPGELCLIYCEMKGSEVLEGNWLVFLQMLLYRRVYIFAPRFHCWNLLCLKLGWNYKNNPTLEVIIMTLVSTTTLKILMSKEMSSWPQSHIEEKQINTVRSLFLLYDG